MTGITTVVFLTVLALQNAYCSDCSNAGNSAECLHMLEAARMADIKARILEKLHMLDNSIVQISSRHRDEYSSIVRGIEGERGEYGEQQDDIEKVIVLAVDPYHGDDPYTLVAQFPVIEQTKQREVLQATLHVFLFLRHNLEKATAVQVRVKEVSRDGTVGDEIAAETAIIQESCWLPIQLDPISLQRLWSEESIVGLTVEASVEGRNVAVHPQNMDLSSENMFLSLQLRPIVQSRFRRRVTPVCEDSMNETECCLYDLYVDFVEFGWNFILAPQKFNARICRGECKKREPSYGAHNRVTSNKSISTDQVKAKDLSCCHPSEYDPLKIVYLNQKNQITIARMEGMISRKCSC